jgi:hypothetical protein
MNRQMTQQPRRSYSFGRRQEWRQPATSFLIVTELYDLPNAPNAVTATLQSHPTASDRFPQEKEYSVETAPSSPLSVHRTTLISQTQPQQQGFIKL